MITSTVKQLPVSHINFSAKLGVRGRGGKEGEQKIGLMQIAL